MYGTVGIQYKFDGVKWLSIGRDMMEVSYKPPLEEVAMEATTPPHNTQVLPPPLCRHLTQHSY
jgi:hypothetical protein